jgi:hypothetical protein
MVWKTTMQNISLFDSHGRLIADVDTSQFDAPTLARFEHLREAYAASERADAAHTAAQNEVADAVERLREAKEIHDENFPPQSFHDLWLDTFGRR